MECVGYSLLHIPFPEHGFTNPCMLSMLEALVDDNCWCFTDATGIVTGWSLHKYST